VHEGEQSAGYVLNPDQPGTMVNMYHLGHDSFREKTGFKKTQDADSGVILSTEASEIYASMSPNQIGSQINEILVESMFEKVYSIKTTS
jgi:heterodisulfide reductase subunit B